MTRLINYKLKWYFTAVFQWTESCSNPGIRTGR